MIITRGWLRKNGACREGRDWFLRQRKKDHSSIFKALLRGDSELMSWAEWLIFRLADNQQKLDFFDESLYFDLPAKADLRKTLKKWLKRINKKEVNS